MNLIYVFVAAFLFSSMEVAIKLTGGAFHPVQLNLIRFFVAALILFPISERELKKTHYKINGKDYIHFALSGFLCIVVSMTFYTLSVSFLDAHVAGILFCSNTFFSMILAHFFTSEKISRRTFCSVLLSFAGFLILVNPLHFKGSFLGVIIISISALTFSLYALVGKILYKDKPFKAPTITSHSFFFGVAELLILIGLSHTAPAATFLNSIGLDLFIDIPIFTGINRDNILILLYICIFVTGIGFASHFFAVEKNPVSISSLVFAVKPVLSPIMAAIFLGDIIYPHEVVGIVMISVASSFIFMEQSVKERRIEAHL